MERTTLLSSKLDSGAGSCAFQHTCADIHRINHFSPSSSVAGVAEDHKSWGKGTTAKAGITSPMTRQYPSSKGPPLEPDTCTRVHYSSLDGHDHAKLSTRQSTLTTATKLRRPFVSHGEVSLQGCRRNMEDAVVTVPVFWPGHSFFAVYDGHGGAEVAEACRNRLHVVLAEEMWKKRKDRNYDDGSGELPRQWWTEALEASFRAVDTEVLLPGAGRKDGSGKTTGSTAIVGVVGSKDIVVANCGDSRAVLCRAGEPVPLSYDHKPDRADELARIEAAGGRVINWGGHRVLGVLATSRSIGDHSLKPYVTADPEVTVTPRTDRDEFLILATDGLWDTVSNEAACAVARRCLAGLILPRWTDVDGSDSGGTNAAEVAAVVLAELAMSRGSRDNVSVVVVELRKVTARRRRNAQVTIKRRNATSLSLGS